MDVSASIEAVCRDPDGVRRFKEDVLLRWEKRARALECASTELVADLLERLAATVGKLSLLLLEEMNITAGHMNV